MFLRSYFRSEKSKNIYFEKILNKDSGTALIFLHGLAGSRRQWDKVFHNLSEKYSLYFIDLLGFGYSAKPKTIYTLKTHVEALHRFIEEKVTEKQIILVGHSLGAIVALGYLAKYSKNIKKVVLFSLPFYISATEAMQTIQSYSKPKYFVIDSLLTRITCTLFCYYGGIISRRFTPYMYRHLPKEMAMDGLLHTYNSYITTLYEVIYHQNLQRLFTKDIAKKILLVHGEKDEIALLSRIKDLSKRYKLNLTVLQDEGHGIPNEAKEKAYAILDKLEG